MKMSSKKRKTKSELQEERNKFKKRFIFALILIAFLVIKVSIMHFSDIKQENNISSFNKSEINKTFNQTNQVDKKGTSEKIANSISGFIEGVLELKYPFVIKLFIVLGVIYLIQVMFSITGDLIQMILASFIATKRGIKWIIKKIKGDKENVD